MFFRDHSIIHSKCNFKHHSKRITQNMNPESFILNHALELKIEAVSLMRDIRYFWELFWLNTIGVNCQKTQ